VCVLFSFSVYLSSLPQQNSISSPHPATLNDHHLSQPAYKLNHSLTLTLWQRQCYSEMHKTLHKCTCLFYCYQLLPTFCWRISYVTVQVTEKPCSSHQLLIKQFNNNHVLNLCIALFYTVSGSYCLPGYEVILSDRCVLRFQRSLLPSSALTWLRKQKVPLRCQYTDYTMTQPRGQ
jgi:hypothetical protein